MFAATPTVAASLAYDCLNSVPLNSDAALELVDAIAPYLEFQSGMCSPDDHLTSNVHAHPMC